MNPTKSGEGVVGRINLGPWPSMIAPPKPELDEAGINALIEQYLLDHLRVDNFVDVTHEGAQLEVTTSLLLGNVLISKSLYTVTLKQIYSR